MKALIQAGGLLFAVASTHAIAQLKPLEDSQMSNIQGRPGCLLNSRRPWISGEIAYQDAGFVTIKAIST